MQLQVPKLHGGLALASIAAIVFLSLQIEVLEQVDSLHLYMTSSEIALDGGVALLALSALGVLWWLCVMLLAQIAVAVPWARQYREPLVWRLGLAVPLSQFVCNIYYSLKLTVAPRWHPGWYMTLLIGVLVLVSCMVGMFFVSVPRLQKFCRGRVVPIGWLSAVLCVVAFFSLWAHGVYRFQDYAQAGNIAGTSDLPDIYLITVDALRAQDASFYGYNRATTPNIDRLAQRSTTFDWFVANSNFTTPTTISIETGELPWSHRVFQLDGYLRPPVQDLVESLRQRGYYTAMITSNKLASPFEHRTLSSYNAVEYAAPRNLTGIWLRLTNLIGVNSQQTLSGPLLKILASARLYVDDHIWSEGYASPPEDVFNRAQSLLERLGTGQPRFLWTHILPPHTPYVAPPPYKARYLAGSELTRNRDFTSLQNSTLPSGVSPTELRDRYDEMILYADQAVGDFIDWLDKTGRLDRSIVIVSADHGESFEHNWYFHTGPYLYNGLIQVPLLIHLPGQRQAAHISYPAQQADLLPTLLDLVGGQVPSSVDGVSLKPVLEGKPLGHRYVFSMNLQNNRIFDPITKGTIAVLDDQFKYVNYLDRHQEVLYRYKTDPQEEHDLIGTEPEVAKRMHDALFEKLKEANQRYTAKP